MAIGKRGATAKAAKSVASQQLQKSITAVQDTYLQNGIVKELGNLDKVATSACDTVKARLHSAMDRLNGEQQSVVYTMLQQFPAQVRARLDVLSGW